MKNKKEKRNIIVEAGILLVIAGVLLIVLGSLFQNSQNSETNTKYAVGGFIGFIPFGFGNDKRLMWVVVGITALLVLFFVFRNFYK
ncbi:hypothetical protein JXB27_00395 [Candidatus Woesearchaeota archaeon]|nr:hypothetical protein [Candidatus Woesearchaeota archaeon]